MAVSVPNGSIVVCHCQLMERPFDKKEDILHRNAFVAEVEVESFSSGWIEAVGDDHFVPNEFSLATGTITPERILPLGPPPPE